MRAKLIDINPVKSVSISGDEDWLQDIYANFSVPESQTSERPLLTGEVKLQSVADGTAVHVSGEISYAPLVECARCSEPLIWPLKIPLNVYFQPEPEQVAKTQSLNSSQLEQYYYKDNESIDLEELINDQIHMLLPDRVTCELQTGEHCMPDLDKPQESAHDRENPFAVLSNLKVEDN